MINEFTTVNQWAKEYAMASYLLVKNQACAIVITGIQEYVSIEHNTRTAPHAHAPRTRTTHTNHAHAPRTRTTHTHHAHAPRTRTTHTHHAPRTRTTHTHTHTHHAHACTPQTHPPTTNAHHKIVLHISYPSLLGMALSCTCRSMTIFA
jgi:hypothetical protein